MKPVLVVVIVAVLGYLIWERHFSRDARIESAFNACMKELGANPEKAKPDTSAPTPLAMDVAGSLPFCAGALKETCTKDFDGQICQAALKRYQ